MAKQPKPSRIVMHPAARRSELIDAAQALFFERGYEATTITAIMERAGVSKGGLYHHFASKEEILEALALRLAEQSLDRLGNVFDEPGLDGLARLNRFFARARQLKIEDAPQLRAAFDVLFKPESVVLYHRINDAIMPVVTPVLARIIAQGKAEGLFDVPDPEATAALVLQISAGSRELMARAMSAGEGPEAEAIWDAFEDRLRFYGIAVDRILGIADGSVAYVEPGFVRALMTARRSR